MKTLLSIILIACLGCSSGSKYIAQNDNYSCGPVALYNALVDKGEHRSVEELRVLAKTITGQGTPISTFLEAAEALGFKLKLIESTDLDYDNHNKKYFVAMTIHKDHNLKKEGGHYIYIANGKAYNLIRDVPEVILGSVLAQGILYKGNNEYFPLVWEIE